MEPFAVCPHCNQRHRPMRTLCPMTGASIGGSAASKPPAPNAEAEVVLPVVKPVAAPTRHRPSDARQQVASQRLRPSDSAQQAASKVAAKRAPSKRPSGREKELVGRTLDGKYRVRSAIGEGALGAVFDAHHLGLDREVALKVLHPGDAQTKASVERFHREARAAGAIGHPNICRVYDFGALDDGSPYMVLEKLSGETLESQLATQGRLSVGYAIDIFVQILAGLSAAHEKGIVHRDINPSNIFLAANEGATPLVKILDFGVSKLSAALLDGDDSLTLTGRGVVIGTPAYVAPEQARAERTLDGRADLYSCGVMLFEALTGKRPSSAPKRASTIRPSLPVALDRILERAMAPTRESRYPNALDFQRDLHAVRVVPPPPLPPLRARSPSEVTETDVDFIDGSDDEDVKTTILSASKRPR